MPPHCDTMDGPVVKLDRPLITQVSRFACEEVPDLQFALVGSMALDDPEGWDVHRQSAADREGAAALAGRGWECVSSPWRCKSPPRCS